MKKLVTSTSALIGRRPMDSRRRCSHSGLGPFRTLRTVRPSTQGQASGMSMAQVTALDPLPGTGSGAQGRKVPKPAAARSRATPRTDRASPRLGVTLISMTASSSPAQSA